jgi:hypothetical protein
MTHLGVISIQVCLSVAVGFLGNWPNAKAEYRVFEYIVYPLEPIEPVAPQEAGDEMAIENPNGPKIFMSALPMQAFSNFKNIKLEQIFLKRTWICGGHTGHHREYCQSPYPKDSTIK